MSYIDLHCDTLNILGQKTTKPFITTDFLIKNNCLAQCFAIFIEQSGKSEVEFEFLKKQTEIFKRFVKENIDTLSTAQSGIEVIKNKIGNRISAVLTVENGDFIGDDLTRIDYIKNAGVKILTLLWNDENCLGYPASTIKRENLLPLKQNTSKIITLLNNKNIIIDVSHLNEGGFWQIAELSTKPFIASHSCCNAIHRHRRNLSDNQIKEIAKCGGVIGINFYNDFINGGIKPTSVSDIVRQAEHIINISSDNAVSLGGDLDGIPHCIDFKGYEDIVSALQNYFGKEISDKICYKNALRVLDY